MKKKIILNKSLFILIILLVISTIVFISIFKTRDTRSSASSNVNNSIINCSKYTHPTTYTGPGPCVKSSTFANNCYAPRKTYVITGSCFTATGGSCYYNVPNVQTCRYDAANRRCLTMTVSPGKDMCKLK